MLKAFQVGPLLHLQTRWAAASTEVLGAMRSGWNLLTPRRPETQVRTATIMKTQQSWG